MCVRSGYAQATQSALNPAQGRSSSAQARAVPCSAWQLEGEGEKGVGSPLNSWIYASSIGKNISALDKYSRLPRVIRALSKPHWSMPYLFDDFITTAIKSASLTS